MPAAPASPPAIPWLLRGARECYGRAVRRRLAAAELDELPASGMHVLGGMALQGASAATIIRELRITRQAASQLVDGLVVHGYLERGTDPTDRRRVTLQLTEKGRAAASAVLAGVADVDRELGRRVTPEQIEGLRAGLAALTEIRDRLGAQP